MITLITKKQKKVLDEMIVKYRNISKEPQDKQAAREAIEEIWEGWGYEKPEIIFSPNPIVSKTWAFHLKKGSKKSFLKLQEQLHSLDSELDLKLHLELNPELDSELRSKIKSELDSELYLELRSKIKSELESEPHLKLASGLSPELDLELKSELGKFENIGYVSTYWLIWLCFYKFGEYIGAELDQKKLALFEKYLVNIQHCIPYQNLVIISEKPTFYTFRDKVLHNEDQAAYQFKGYKMYYLFGIRFDKKLFEKTVSKELTLQELSEIENTEQRYAILRFNPGILLEKAELIDEKLSIVNVPYTVYEGKEMVVAGRIIRHGDVVLVANRTPDYNGIEVNYRVRQRLNRTYKVEIDNNVLFFVRKKCPSTGKEYFEWITEEMAQDANLAVATQMGITVDEYLNEVYAET